MSSSSTRAPQRARIRRYFVAGTLAIASAAVLPIAFAGAAQASEGSDASVTTSPSAAADNTNTGHTSTDNTGTDGSDNTDGQDPGPSCIASHWTGPAPTISVDDNGVATATITVAAPACDGKELSLAAYATNGSTWETAGEQTLSGSVTKRIDGATTLSLTVPDCFFQVDLITGSDIPKSIPAGVAYFTDHDALLASANGGKACVAPTESTTPPTTPPTSVEAETFTKAPQASVKPAAASLPFTGNGAPVGTMLTIGLSLIAAGGTSILVVRKRGWLKSAGSHR